MSNPRFFVRSEADLQRLPRLLEPIAFDEYSISWDKNGNQMLGLSKRISRSRIDYRGLVVITDEALNKQAEEIVSKRVPQ